MTLSAVLDAPCGRIGVEWSQQGLTGLEFLPLNSVLHCPVDPFLERVVQALACYWAEPRYRFDLPLEPRGTPFRLRVWQALMAIPVGRTVTYGELAQRLGSSPRAVGQALGDNPLPIVIPCHRVVSASGGLGGFNHSNVGFSVEIKRWLLTHEGVL